MIYDLTPLMQMPNFQMWIRLLWQYVKQLAKYLNSWLHLFLLYECFQVWAALIQSNMFSLEHYYSIWKLKLPSPGYNNVMRAKSTQIY